jgi:hypothetical protein
LLKTTFLSFAVVIIVISFRRLGARGRQVFWIVAGLCVALAPALIRNAIVGVGLFSLSSVGPVTFINSNSVYYSPDMGAFFDVYHDAQILPDHRGMLGVVWSTIRTHPGILHYIGLLLRKLLTLFHWYEYPDNANFYFVREHVWGLWLVPISFGLVSVFALVCLPSVLKQWSRMSLLILALLTALLPIVAFYSSSRLRLPLVALMLVLAGGGVSTFLNLLVAPRSWQFWLAVAVLASATIVVERPLSSSRSFIRYGDYTQPYMNYYASRVDEARGRRDFETSLHWMTEALEYAPDFVRRPGPCYINNGPDSTQIANWYIKFYELDAFLLERVGRSDESQAARQEMETLRHPCLP